MKKRIKNENETAKKRLFGRGSNDIEEEDGYDGDDEYDEDDDEYDEEDKAYDEDDEYDGEDEDDEYDDDDGEYDDDDEYDDDEYDDDEYDDDDDDDYDDEDEDEEEDEEDEEASRHRHFQGNTVEDKREKRRKRRVRNQAIAYISLFILVFGIVFGVYNLGNAIIDKIQSGSASEETTEDTSQIDTIETEVVISEPDAIVETEEEDPLETIVSAAIAEMPLEDKVAAMFFITPEQLTGVSQVTQAGETTQTQLQTYKVGGLYYTKNNISSSDQLKELLSKTATIDQTLFLAVEEQGGDLAPVANALSLAGAPSAAEIGAGGDASKAYSAGATVGSYLYEYGFNMTMAPIADVTTTSGTSVLGDNSFGSDVTTVGHMSASYISGLKDNQILSCVRTFPGLGGVSADAEEGLTSTQRSQAEMEAAEFLAYQSAVEAGAEFLMVGTISAPNLTGENTPVCLSATALALVRNTLGFDGVIITDSLSDATVTQYYTSSEAAIKAVRAGADMLLMTENFEEAYTGLLTAVQDGTIDESRIDESLMRIYRVKYRDRLDNITEE